MKTKELQPMRTGRFCYSVKIYVAGGQNDTDSHLNSVKCYDPVVDEWSQIANMSYPRVMFGLVCTTRNALCNGRSWNHRTLWSSTKNLDLIKFFAFRVFQVIIMSGHVSLIPCVQIGSHDEHKKIRWVIILRGQIYILMDNELDISVFLMNVTFLSCLLVHSLSITDATF